MKQFFNFLSLRLFVLKCFAILVFLLVAKTHAIAFEDKSAEYALKAGFLYNFTQFIEWPEETAAIGDTFYAPFDFSMCVVGQDPFGKFLEVLADNLNNQGRPMNIIRIGM